MEPLNLLAVQREIFQVCAVLDDAWVALGGNPDGSGTLDFGNLQNEMATPFAYGAIEREFGYVKASHVAVVCKPFCCGLQPFL